MSTPRPGIPSSVYGDSTAGLPRSVDGPGQANKADPGRTMSRTAEGPWATKEVGSSTVMGCNERMCKKEGEKREKRVSEREHVATKNPKDTAGGLFFRWLTVTKCRQCKFVARASSNRPGSVLFCGRQLR